MNGHLSHFWCFSQVHLAGSPRVGSVAITISPGSYQHFTIFVVELLEGNKAMYKPCSKFEGRFQVSSFFPFLILKKICNVRQQSLNKTYVWVHLHFPQWNALAKDDEWLHSLSYILLCEKIMAMYQKWTDTTKNWKRALFRIYSMLPWTQSLSTT